MIESNNNIVNDASYSLVALLDHFDNAKTEDYGINLKPSPYYEHSDFILTQFHSGISILSLNIQSISAKFNELCVFIDTISEKAMIKIICLQETWLSENTNTAPYQLENYNLISKGKLSCGHGGLIIYIHNSLKFNIVPTNITTSNWECLTVDVLDRLNSKHILTILPGTGAVGSVVNVARLSCFEPPRSGFTRVQSPVKVKL